jgi:hypothetical protein
MHVRIAWEIYHHQAKQNPEKASSAGGIKQETMLRPNMYPPPSSPSVRQHELSPAPGYPPVSVSMAGRPFDPLAANFLASQSSMGEFCFETFPIISSMAHISDIYRRDVTIRTVLFTIRVSLWKHTVALRERNATRAAQSARTTRPNGTARSVEEVREQG